MGLGAFPAPHDAVARACSGMHGTRAANYAMDEADLICAIGARFDDRITGKLSEFAPRAKFIHIDIDPAEISKNVPAHIPIVGDAQEHPRASSSTEYRALEADSSRLDEWWQRIDGWQRAPPAALRGLDATAEIKPQLHDPGAATRRPAATRSSPPTSASTRCGRRSTSTSTEPRRWINSGGLGTMGFGLPAAMGAKVGCPDQTVVCIAGDGSVQMNIQELATCAEEGIAVKVFIMNNGYLGMVRQWQELFWDRRYSHVDMGSCPDFVKLAEAYGAHRHALHGQDDARRRHARGDRDARPRRRRRRASPQEENVYPMIAPGAAARDMVG